MNFQSIPNQKVCGMLVERNIFGGPQTSLVEALIRLKQDGQDVDIDEYYGEEIFTVDLSTEEWSGTDNERKLKIEAMDALYGEISEEIDMIENYYELSLADQRKIDDLRKQQDDLQHEMVMLEHAEGEYPEIYEWWMTNDWFAGKLREKGEVVIEAYGNYYYGRQCTGQAIHLDNVIGEIASDMQILDGQPNSWAV